MKTIRVARVGSRVEAISAEELLIRVVYERGLFVLTPDDRLLPVGADADWRASVAAVTGRRPPSGDQEDQRAVDLAALDEAFGAEA